MIFDVSVIGAGPSGATAAWKIGELGWKTALFERDAFAGKNNVCAGGVYGGIFDELNLKKSVIERRIHTRVIENKNGVVVKFNTNSVMVQRSVFDRAIAKKAADFCDYFPSTEIDFIKREKDYWILKAGVKKFKTRIIIFADGPISLIRKKLGVGFQAGKNKAYGSIIRDFKLLNPGNICRSIFDEKVSPFGYGWIFSKKDHVNVGLGFISNSKVNSEKSFEYLLKKYFPELLSKNPFNKKGAIIPCEIAKKNSDQRGLIAVGDAGGFVEPFTGEGIAKGVLSSLIASEVVNEALEKNDVKLVKNFDKKIKSQDWYWYFKSQEIVFKIIGLHPFLFNQFILRIFAKGLYIPLISIPINIYKNIIRLRGSN